MEISILPKSSIKIKGKKSSLIIDSSSLATKAETDGVILFNNPNAGVSSKASSYRVVIAGPGDYEVGGIKISGIRQGSDTYYIIHIDGLSMLLCRVGTVDKLKDSLAETQISLLYADKSIDKASVGILSSKIVAIYGERLEEYMQTFSKGGDDDTQKKATGKIVVSYDKLPSEMDFFFLQS